MIEEIIHLDGMRERLPSHTRVGDKLDTLMQVFAARYQAMELVMLDLFTLREIETATGVQLDGIGQIVDLARESGQTDTSYRLGIRSRFIVVTKSGSVEEVIQAYTDVMGATDAEYTEIYPATFQISALPGLDVSDPDIAEFISVTMQGIKAAGVNMLLLTDVGFELSDSYEADVDGNGPSDADEGFGSNTYGEDEGGGLARAI